MSIKSSEVSLSINHITVRYLGKILFPNLSLTIHRNEHWVVTGKSGAGKTSLLQTILGKYNIINGNTTYPFFESFKSNHQIDDPLFTQYQLMAMVTQEPHFRNKQNRSDFYYQQRFNALDAEEAVTVNEYLNQTLSSVNPLVLSAGMRFSLNWIIKNLNLGDLLNKTIIQLSHGETRRLLIAQALLRQPLWLMLDNPFMGLDVRSRAFFHQLMSQIAEKGIQLMIITPPDEIPDCITHILELEQGVIKREWLKEDFIRENKTPKQLTAWRPAIDKLIYLRQRNISDRYHFSNVLSMHHIHVRYGNTLILHDINWTVKKGEKWALIGHNGAGKSTLLSLITGDNPQAYANDIHLFDHKRGGGESIWDIKHKIGFVSPEMHRYFQSNSRCIEVILSGYTDTMAVIHKKISEQQRSFALSWMELLELEGLKDRQFKQLSSGEQRLILLLRALVKNPPLLILDEPCQGLDEEQKAHFKSIIEIVCNDPAKTLIYVTHYAEEIPSCVSRTLHLSHGEAVEEKDWIPDS